MLTKIQANDIRRHEALNKFFDKHATVVSTYPPLENEVNLYKSNFSELKTFTPQKEANSKGTTKAKTKMRADMASSAAIICATVRAFALRFNNPDLAAQMNISKTTIIRTSDPNLKALILFIKKQITPWLTHPDFIPYGITLARLSALTGAATVYDKMIPKAKLIRINKSLANNHINELLNNKLKKNIEHFNLLMSHFNNSNPDFFLEYQLNAAIKNLGHRYTGIKGHVKAPDGTPLAATIQILGTKKQTTTDLTGQYTLIKVRGGLYEIEFSSPGFKTHKRTFRIFKAHTKTLDIVLEKDK